MDIRRTEDGKLEAYVFVRHPEGSGIGAVKESFGNAPGVAFVAQFVGAFCLFGRVVADQFTELQGRIDTEYWGAGVRSDWSLNLTADREARPKRGSPDFCAMVRAEADGNPFEIIKDLDGQFLDQLPDGAYGAAVVTGDGYDLLVDLGADTPEGAVALVMQLRAIPGIARTATAIADLSNGNAIRPPEQS
jgi:hypothetical protein